MRQATIVLLWLVGFAVTLHAAEPPDYVNYQGVLRDAAGQALDGDYEMEFHFYDSAFGGSRLLSDIHRSTEPVGPVTVSGGLFNAHLGGGTIDPGTHATLGEAFGDRDEVWLEVEIQQPPGPGEVLSPRIRVIAAPYALNAGRLDGLHAGAFASSAHGHTGNEISGQVAEASNADTLDGKHANQFIDTSANLQAKAGGLAITEATHYGIEAHGVSAGGHFNDSDQSGWANVGVGDIGVEGYGAHMGAYFKDIDNLSEARLGSGNRGVEATGSEMGGYFADSDSSGYAHVGIENIGVQGYGSYMGVQGFGEYGGAYFQDLDLTSNSTIAVAGRGISAIGDEMGGNFRDADGSGTAYVAYGDRGIEAYGQEAGGYFQDSDNMSVAKLGSGNMGIEAHGSEMGGFFANSNSSGTAMLGSNDIGIEAKGDQLGGWFYDSDQSGYAHLGYGDRGVAGYGDAMGGYFYDLDNFSSVELASGTRGLEAIGSEMGGFLRSSNYSGYAHVGSVDRGIEGFGAEMGGYFSDIVQSGYAHVGYGDKGIEAFGSYMGGYFKDINDLSDAKIAFGGYGIRAYGSGVGGGFNHLTSGNWAELGGGTYKILGNGANPAFVQNHPERNDRVIVYTAPEGNEIATYTRGTARLFAGEARVELDETFGWVTSPDIGLSAQLTPRGECNGLYVDSLSTEELRVRELSGGESDVIFDYVVWGLRVGFEELPVVQEKTREAYLPRIDETLAVYERLPELRQYNAFERFKTMRAANGEAEEVNLTASVTLRDAIGIFDPAIHGIEDEETSTQQAAELPDGIDATGEPATSEARPDAARSVVHERATRAAEEPEGTERSLARYPTSRPVEAGDVVVLDPVRPGHLRPASTVADPTVFGIAGGPAENVDGQPCVELVEGRYAEVKADASYGAILPGDLLVSSPTPGHVMRATAPLSGTIVGKAAESLETDSGSIRVLVMLR
jgi:hypothetical protein